MTRSLRLPLRPSTVLPLALAATLAAAPAVGAQRPDSLPPAARDTVPRPVVAARAVPLAARPAGPPVSPKNAAFSSMAMPGLGQGKLGRNKARAIFWGFEIVSIYMLQRTANNLVEAKRAPAFLVDSLVIDSVTSIPAPARFRSDSLRVVHLRFAAIPNNEHGRVRARRSQYEDWVALLIFNHLISAADAFVAAQLWDLPIEVHAARQAPPSVPFGPGVAPRGGYALGVTWRFR